MKLIFPHFTHHQRYHEDEHKQKVKNICNYLKNESYDIHGNIFQLFSNINIYSSIYVYYCYKTKASWLCDITLLDCIYEIFEWRLSQSQISSKYLSLDEEISCIEHMYFDPKKTNTFCLDIGKDNAIIPYGSDYK